MEEPFIRILLRRGTKENLTDDKYVALQGEPVFEINTGKLKFGDGISEWKDLKYFNESDDVRIDEIAHKKILDWLVDNYYGNYFREGM